MNVFYDKYKKYKSKYLTMKGGAAASNFVNIKFNCKNIDKDDGMDSKKIETLDASNYNEYKCTDKIEVIVKHIEEQTGNPVKLIRNSHVLIPDDKYKSNFDEIGMCNGIPKTINYILKRIYPITSEEQIQMIIKSMEFIKMFSESIILLCPYAANVTETPDYIDCNIKQGLNIDAILFAKKINKQLVIINMDLAFLSKSEKILTPQTTDYLDMDLVHNIKNEEIEINIYNNPKIKEEQLYKSYYDKLKQHLGDDFITILNDIKLVVINFGVHFIKQPDDITLTSIVETLSEQFRTNFICYKFFAENFPTNLYINGIIKSQDIIYEEQIQMIIKSMGFIKMFSGSIILLCPNASNVTENPDYIDHNIQQGLNIDAILFAKKINKRLVIINMDRAFLSKLHPPPYQTTDYLNMSLTNRITNEINIYNRPNIKEEQLYKSYYDKLKQHLGDEFITILNDIKLVVINFGINFIMQPDDVTLTSMVKTLSKQFRTNFICYKFFAENFPTDLYINGIKKSQDIIYEIEKQKEIQKEIQMKVNARIELHKLAIHKIKDTNIIEEHKKAIHMIFIQLEYYHIIEEYEKRILILREQDDETYQQNIQIIKEHEKDINRIKENYKEGKIKQIDAISMINEHEKTISKIKEKHGEVNHIIGLRLETMNRIEEQEKAINEIEENISKMAISKD